MWFIPKQTLLFIKPKQLIIDYLLNLAMNKLNDLFKGVIRSWIPFAEVLRMPGPLLTRLARTLFSQQNTSEKPSVAFAFASLPAGCRHHRSLQGVVARVYRQRHARKGSLELLPFGSTVSREEKEMKEIKKKVTDGGSSSDEKPICGKLYLEPKVITSNHCFFLTIVYSVSLSEKHF